MKIFSQYSVVVANQRVLRLPSLLGSSPGENRAEYLVNNKDELSHQQKTSRSFISWYTYLIKSLIKTEKLGLHRTVSFALMRMADPAAHY